MQNYVVSKKYSNQLSRFEDVDEYAYDFKNKEKDPNSNNLRFFITIWRAIILRAFFLSVRLIAISHAVFQEKSQRRK